MNDFIEMGPIKWIAYPSGIKGGYIKLHIIKNRTSFVKKFTFNQNEEYELAQKICKEKVSQILHLKNQKNPNLSIIANYCLNSTSIEEIIIKERKDLINIF
jgi:hypothetical protein